MQQSSFDFDDPPLSSPRSTDPPPKRTPRGQGSGICAYCGWRVPNPYLPTTPQLTDDISWRAHSAHHASDCRWVLTRGLRLDDRRPA
jgi:hypothetical protein